MSRKPRLGGRVQISGEQYTVLAESHCVGEWFLMLAMRNKTGGSYYVRSETWRGGCGPWRVKPAQSQEQT